MLEKQRINRNRNSGTVTRVQSNSGHFCVRVVSLMRKFQETVEKLSQNLNVDRVLEPKTYFMYLKIKFKLWLYY